ncbi:MAG TPA: hypothetical protein VGC99_28795 [Candidatus Tectomicrobia bacterium]
MRLRRRVYRWITTQREAYTEFQLRRRREAKDRREEEARQLMELNALEQAQTRALLAQLDHHTVEAIKAVLQEEVLPTLRDEALTLAREELTEELAKAKERLEDRYAALVSSFEDEVERRIEDGIQRGTQDLKADLEDTITDLKRERQEACQQRDQAQAQLVALVQQLLPPDKRVYLYTTGMRQLDLAGLNSVLARVGLVVKARQTYSERLVACQTGPGRVEGKTLFWLEKALPAGVVVIDAEEGSEEMPGNPDVIPSPLALPEGTGL